MNNKPQEGSVKQYVLTEMVIRATKKCVDAKSALILAILDHLFLLEIVTLYLIKLKNMLFLFSMILGDIFCFLLSRRICTGM